MLLYALIRIDQSGGEKDIRIDWEIRIIRIVMCDVVWI